MNIFLAGECSTASCYEALFKTPEVQREVKLNPNNYTLPLKKLHSFAYKSELKRILKYIKHYKMFMLDSGAFTMLQKKHDKMDFNSYLDEYIEFINKYDIKNFFELDIDSVVGYKKVLDYRQVLERDTNKQCIPVWHRSRGKDDYLRMCDEYSYVALGGISIKEIKKSEHKFFPWFINEAHKRGAKIHGLGYTSLLGLRTYPFDSVDSSTWTTAGRFGIVYHFDGRNLKRYTKPINHRTILRTAVAHNFIEWVKFSEYAELHL